MLLRLWRRLIGRTHYLVSKSTGFIYFGHVYETSDGTMLFESPQYLLEVKKGGGVVYENWDRWGTL